MIFEMFDWFMEHIGMPFIMIITVLMIIALPFMGYSIYKDSRSETFELKKKDWSCTLEHEYITTTMIMVGKVMVPQMITHHDCIKWEHK